jgi:hypothetical protein
MQLAMDKILYYNNKPLQTSLRSLGTFSPFIHFNYADTFLRLKWIWKALSLKTKKATP